MAITNSQQARQMYNQGGYADMGLMAPRQNYGLGSFVKKAVRGVKKIAKSPIGKAALLYAGGAYLGGSSMMGGAGGSFMSRMANPSNLMNLASNSNSTGLFNLASRAGNSIMGTSSSSPGNPSFLSKLNPFGENFSGKTALLTGGVAATALPFLMGGDDEVEEVSESFAGMPSSIKDITGQARAYYSGGAKDSNLNFMPQKKYVSENFYAADGGRAGYANGMLVDDEEEEFMRSGAGRSFRQPQTFLNMGGGAGDQQAQQMLMMAYAKYKKQGGDMPFEQFVQAVMQQQQSQGMEQPTMAANGGRMGYENAGPVIDQETINMVIDMNSKGMDMDTITQITGQPVEVVTNIISSLTQQAGGGLTSVPGYGTPAGTNKFGYPSGGVRVNAAEGGIMDAEAAEMIDMGGQEKDYRDEGGFVAMGGEERADDVPARLSKNEFVFTADAVRNAGGGDIDRGSEVMQNLMDNLEQGGQVSEDSQGLGGEEMMSEEIIEEPNGAQAMYEQQQALQSRMA